MAIALGHNMRLIREDVEAILGELDDFLLAKILAVGASPAELREAALVAVRDYEMGESVRHGSSPRVNALSAIIEELLQDDDEAGDYPDAYGPTRVEGHNDRG